MAKKLKYNVGIAPDQSVAFQAHWCVDTDLGLETLDCILLDLHAEGKISREEYRSLTTNHWGIEDE